MTSVKKQMNLKKLVPVLVLAVITACGHAAGDRPADTVECATGRQHYGAAMQVGTIATPDISEASGIAAGADGLFWVINDSGNPPDLFAIGADGLVRDRFTIADTPNIDWEDLAAFTLDRIPYLLIADVGDNLAGRDRCMLFVVREPELTDGPSEQKRQLTVQWRIRFRYPDGPRDCEAVAVDVPRKRVLLLSKRDKPPLLYELPLQPASETVVAARLGPMTAIPPPTPADLKHKYGFSWSRPTAMDLSADGNRLVVLTYKHAYAFIKTSGQSWPAIITLPPLCIPLPHPDTGLPIREALCIEPKSGDLLVTGETPPAPIFRLPAIRR